MNFGERLIRRLVSASSLRLAESISKQASLELIGRLHPIDSGHPLIRIGPVGDGGYLIPDDLDGVTHCFSPGVAAVSGFELDLVDRGIACFLADNSVESPEITHNKLVFEKKYIGCYSDDSYLTFDDWVENYLPANGDDLLMQMDIEGAEYEVLLNISDELLQRFRIMVVEFHFVSRWFDKPYYAIVQQVFRKILRHFDVVHVHPNNYCALEEVNDIEIPPLIEITFLRKNRFLHRTPNRQFPHPLDADNVSKPSIVLPKCWYKS